MKRKRRRLALNRSTVRNLQASELLAADGGLPSWAIGSQTMQRCTSSNSTQDFNRGGGDCHL